MTEKEWHYSIDAYCYEHSKAMKFEQLKKESIMKPISRVLGTFKFKCSKCNKILIVETREETHGENKP